MKRAISVMFIFILILNFFPYIGPVVYAKEYTDVTQASFSDIEIYEAIMYVSDNGYMTGTSSTNFSPNTNLTRAQLVQILYSMKGKPSANYAIPFTDVPTNAWYRKAVCWAYHFGVVTGTTATTFSPNANVIIQDAIVMLYKYACLTQSFTVDMSLLSTINDGGSVSGSTAKTAMNWALQYCVVQPDSTNQIHPQYYVPRKTQALFICRYDKNVVGFFDGKKKYTFLNSEATNLTEPETKALLIQIIQDTFPTNLANSIIVDINDYSTQNAGKCFGMSSTMLFDAIGRVDFNKKVGNYNKMSTIPNFTSDTTVRNWINFYVLGEAAAIKCRYHVNTVSKLSSMCTNIQKHGPTIMSFFFHIDDVEYGHSVLLLSMKQSDTSGNYDIELYDPNSSSIVATQINLNYIGTLPLDILYYYTASNIKTLKYLDCDGTYNNQ